MNTDSVKENDPNRLYGHAFKIPRLDDEKKQKKAVKSMAAKSMMDYLKGKPSDINELCNKFKQFIHQVLAERKAEVNGNLNKELSEDRIKFYQKLILLPLRNTHLHLYEHLNDLMNKPLKNGQTILEFAVDNKSYGLLVFLSQFSKLTVTDSLNKCIQALGRIPEDIRGIYQQKRNTQAFPNHFEERPEIIQIPPNQMPLITKIRLEISEIIHDQAYEHHLYRPIDQEIKAKFEKLMSLFFLVSQDDQDCIEEICSHVKFLLISLDGKDGRKDKYKYFNSTVKSSIFKNDKIENAILRETLINTFRNIKILDDLD